MKPKKILLNLLLLLGTLLFSLVVLEMALRFFAPQGLTKSQIEPDLGWINVPNTRYVFHHKEFNTPIHYNSYGMRDVEHTRSKSPGVFRIAVLGDSFIEGRQVPFDSLYSRVLEHLLKEKGLNCEVLNFGVHAYSTDQEIVLLKKYALEFDPDLVIVSMAKNDVATNVANAICGLDPNGNLQITPPGAPLGSQIRAWLYRNSHLFTFLNFRLPKLMSAGARKRNPRKIFEVGDVAMWSDLTEAQQDLNPTLMPLYAKVEDPRVDYAKRLMEAILKEIDRVCRERDVKFILLINSARFQIQPQSWDRKLKQFNLAPEEYDHEAVDRWLLDFAAQVGFPAISSAKRFRDLKARKGMSFHWRIDGHWNSNGHREAARLTVEVLDSLGLPPS